jgi:tetratricopeptide (TPR) repeat protein
MLRGLSTLPSDRYASMEELLAALEQRPWPVRHVRLTAVTVAAAAVAALTGVVALRHPAAEPPTPCGGGEARLAGVWDAARKAGVQRAFAATQAAYANDSWGRVSRLLDDYTAGWTKMHSEACQATKVRHEQSEELFNLRAVCLDDRLRSVTALTKVFTEADAKVVEKSVDAVQRLPSLDGCANKAALLAGVRPLADPAKAARAEAVRDRIAEAAALESAGKYKEGLAVAEKSVAEARSLDDVPAEAEALFQLGHLQELQGNLKLAVPTLQETAAVAEAGAHYAVAARAWLELESCAAEDRRDDDAQRFLRYAATAIERSGGSEELEAMRILRLGTLLYDEGKGTEALQAHQRAKELFERTAGPTSGRFATALDALAVDLFSLGRYSEALELETRAVEIFEHAHGPLHPGLAHLLDNVAGGNGRIGRYEEALAFYRRGLAIAEQSWGPQDRKCNELLVGVAASLTMMRRGDEALEYLRRARKNFENAGLASDPDYARILHNMGDAERSKGAYDAALTLYRRALDISVKAGGGPNDDDGITHSAIGEVYLAKGRYQAAVHELSNALPLVDTPTDSIEAASILTALGEAFLGLHDTARAAPPLERAVALHASDPGDPADRARAQFALARVRWATGDHDHARELAEQARATYASARWFKDDMRRIDDWIAAHK